MQVRQQLMQSETVILTMGWLLQVVLDAIDYANNSRKVRDCDSDNGLLSRGSNQERLCQQLNHSNKTYFDIKFIWLTNTFKYQIHLSCYACDCLRLQI